MPKLCLKCGNYDPAETITPASRCPACGVVYAKMASASLAGAPAPEAAGQHDSGWTLTDTQLWGSLAAVALLFALLVFDEDGFVMLLDHTNLAFHEAGHLFFGILGNTPGLYGGTLGQLVFPVVAAATFWQRREAAAFALSGVWFFENFLNIARYMADARVQLLPLVGGGEHDWFHIFSRWGVLDADTGIAGFVRIIGWLGMLACVAWLWWQRGMQRRSD